MKTKHLHIQVHILDWYILPRINVNHTTPKFLAILCFTFELYSGWEWPQFTIVFRLFRND